MLYAHSCHHNTISRSRRGAALVEMAVVMMLLLMLVLGILEFGFMFRNYLTLNEVSRAGVRSASLGSTTGVVSNHVQESANALGLNSQYLTGVAQEYRTYEKATGTWSGWATLGDTGSYNSAPCSVTYDSQIRVKVTYRYPLVTGSFFSSIFGDSGQITLTGISAMRREETPS